MATHGRCKENRGQLSYPPPAALYVHVPFCQAKCRYCDFYSIAFNPAAGRRLLQAIGKELALRGGPLTAPAASIFVGGGTPTSLGAELLSELLAMLAPWVGEATEFSVEANPGTVTPPVAEALAAAAVNRVNLGIQSFDRRELGLLGRVHTAAQAREAAGVLRGAGLGSLGADLIYGIPGQRPANWRASLRQAVELGIEHLSCYALSFEANTPLERDLRAGSLRAMPPARQERLYRLAIEAAASAGLEHYEISNFARPGRRCRHNLTYWRNEPYLGIGPAAASYIDGVRRTNRPDVEAYCRALEAHLPPPATQEQLTGRAAMAETVMLGLRLIEGLDRQSFADRYGLDVLKAFPASTARYLAIGALEATADHLRIAPARLFVADTILADILAEA